MKQKLIYSLIIFLMPLMAFCQGGTVQNASIPKDAPVNVILTDFKNNILNNEIVIFKSALNSKEYQGLTDSLGKFSFRLPVGDKYEIYILGFKDSTRNENVLTIPPTTGNAYYKNPFVVELASNTADGEASDEAPAIILPFLQHDRNRIKANCPVLL